MKCFDAGTLQAYIDGELEIDVKKKLESHLEACPECKGHLDELKANDDFAFAKINSYRQFTFDNAEPSGKAAVPKRKNLLDYSNPKGVENFMFKYKKLLAAACSIALVVTCLSFQPVRAAISNALSIFRVDNVQGIKVTLDDIQQIQKKLNGMDSQIDMDKLGKITRQGGESKQVSVDEALKLAGDSVSLLPAGLSSNKPEITTTEPARIEFNLNVENVNSVLKSFGTQKLLPENIENKTFAVNFPRQFSINYKIGNKTVSISQMRSPEIEVPEGVNADEIYECLVNLPILPDNIKNQLKSIKDWQHTMYVPVLEGQSEEADINGCKGYLTSGIDSRTQQSSSLLVWYNNGVIYGVYGDISKTDILSIAKSIK